MPRQGFDPRKSHLVLRRQWQTQECFLNKRGKLRQITRVNEFPTAPVNCRDRSLRHRIGSGSFNVGE